MTVRLRSALGATLATVLLSAGSIACGQAPRPPDDRPSVVASTDVYAAVATKVAGNRATVTPIIANASLDPHEYEGTAADALAVGRATVLVCNGGGYDDFAGRLVTATKAKPVQINASQLSGLGDAPDFNEHVWYHVPTMAAVADRLAAELGRADPAHADTFTTNAGAFKAQLDLLNSRVKAIAAAHKGEHVVVTEPVAGYLVQAAGLVDVTPPELSRAVENGDDVPAAILQETLGLLHGGKVRAVLINSQTTGPTSDQLLAAARAAGIPVVSVTETLGAGTTDYVTWMGNQIDALAVALGRR